MVEGDEDPAVCRAPGLWVCEVDDEQRLLCTRTFASDLGELTSVHPIPLGPGVLDLDPILVPYSAVSFQVPHGARAGLPPPTELRHDLVLLGDGGALVLLGRDLLELGFWVGLILSNGFYPVVGYDLGAHQPELGSAIRGLYVEYEAMFLGADL